MTNYAGMLSEVLSRPWAMDAGRLTGMVSALKQAASGDTATRAALEHLHAQHELQAASYRSVSARTGSAVAVIPIWGCISHRPSLWSYYFGGSSTGSIAQQFRQALDDASVKAIVFDVDSPGGSTDGVDELSAEIYAGRGKGKKIIAVSNCLNASAAYYLSSAADEVVVSPSSLTGSIGVYCAHEDDSEFLAKLGVKITLITYGENKAAGDSSQPLSDSYRAHQQGIVHTFGTAFDKAVARNRGVTPKDVAARFGQGNCFTAGDAVAAGLANKVGTLESVLARYGVAQNATATSMSASVAVPELPQAKGKKKNEEAPAQDPDDNSDEIVACACDCDSCEAGDCSGCTADPCEDDTCGCGDGDDTDAKAKAALALQVERELMAMQIAL